MALSDPSCQRKSEAIKLAIKKSNQALSSDGRILVTKKGWLLRLLVISCLAVLVLASTLYLGVQNPREQPIYIYSGFLISFSIAIYLIGWILYRNPSTSPSPHSLTDTDTDTNSNKNP